MSNTNEKTPNSPPETTSKGRVGLSSDDLLARIGHRIRNKREDLESSRRYALKTWEKEPIESAIALHDARKNEAELSFLMDVKAEIENLNKSLKYIKSIADEKDESGEGIQAGSTAIISIRRWANS